ncbi:glycosyltransferase family 2 protein [Marivivens donghaensis]|uniref:Glycosyltransferase family 2 protein n=1 Tax=Marivivens donghaensis TaxID=1699413 RepID=A0ABX0VST4_9RHOB|nr:glycosyltransferase family 2 protein [Marivivens donghaensis]NIY71002.1 glycosyltransferase family 2 protein [Marivivens donghaensis]
MTVKISCIIPAYNEEARIGHVLDTVVGHPLVDEVIVVDDGSSDGTADVVAGREGVTFIKMERNRGKTWAVTEGIEAAKGSHLLLVDADLLGLEAWHLTALISPIVYDQADVSISLRKNAPKIWHRIGIDYISGERVIERELLASKIAELRKLPKFGLEVFMNRLLMDRDARIAVVQWPEVVSPFKNAKVGWMRGLTADVKMITDMCRSVPPWGLASQIYKMRRQRVNVPNQA